MSKRYTLDKISKLFQIPKSTLRYWESEGLISSIRNEENDYREYDTNNLVEICDIKFYRSLNFPIKNLREVWQMSISESEELLNNSHKEIESKIAALHNTLHKIDGRLANIKLFNYLKDNPYHIDTPPFSKIIYLHLSETENVIEYIKDQSLLSFAIDDISCAIKSYGTILNGETKNTHKILWESDNIPHTYITCLLKVKNTIIDKDNLNEHLQYIKSINKKAGAILGRYLVSDSLEDYFQVWIEII